MWCIGSNVRCHYNVPYPSFARMRACPCHTSASIGAGGANRDVEAMDSLGSQSDVFRLRGQRNVPCIRNVTHRAANVIETVSTRREV